MFELEIPTTAKLTDVIVLSQKNRQPDENPGAKLKFELQLTNDALSMLDGHLRSALFCKHGGAAPHPQQGLDGVEPVSDLPNLTMMGQQCGTIHWDQDMVGYTLAIRLGTGRKESNIESDGCEVSHLRITPKEGGTINVKFSVEAPNVSEAHFGKLAKLKSRDVDVALLAPVPGAQSDIEDEAAAGKPKDGKQRQREGAEAKAGKR